MGASELDLAVTTSVAIQAMSFSEAEKIVEGDGPRVDLKDWYKPLDPQTKAGTIDLDEIDSDTEDDWYVLGLIPTTSNINDGMRSLDEWHKPVTIEGYLVNPYSINNQTYSLGYYKSGNSTYSHSVDSDCNLDVGINNRQSLYVLVDKIILENSVVSDDGESKDEWTYGDVPFFGRAGFILFFLIVGVGGGVGLFMLSQLFVLQGARSTMKTLLGKEGVAKIKKVASDLRRSKAMGMLSPTERKKNIEKQQKSVKKEEKPKSSSKSSDDTEISGFDLDSVLSSGPSSVGVSEFGSGQSSVDATIESFEMDRENDVRDYDEPDLGHQEVSQPAWKPPKKEYSQTPPTSNVVSNPPETEKKEHFSSIASDKPTRSSAPSQKKKTVRKRKSIKQSTPEPEPEPQKQQSGFNDDDHFSDFTM